MGQTAGHPANYQAAIATVAKAVHDFVLAHLKEALDALPRTIGSDAEQTRRDHEDRMAMIANSTRVAVIGEIHDSSGQLTEEFGNNVRFVVEAMLEQDGLISQEVAHAIALSVALTLRSCWKAIGVSGSNPEAS